MWRSTSEAVYGDAGPQSKTRPRASYDGAMTDVVARATAAEDVS